MISEIHAQLITQREQINQLHTQVANHPTPQETTGSPTITTQAVQAPAFIPKKNKPPTYDGKASPDSWIAHMSSYVYGQPDDHAFSIAITYLSGDAHDWFIANQMAATAAGYPMMTWTALIEALSKRFNPLNKTKLARDKLSRWRQIKDVQTYNTDFLKIIIDIPGIGLDEQLDRYSRGLKPYIWSDLCTTDYKNLEDLMRDAERVESAKSNRFRPNRFNNEAPRPLPIPMDLNAINVPAQPAPDPVHLNAIVIPKLTPEEREKCMREGLCLRCRQQGHMARECPKNANRNYSIEFGPTD